MVQTSKPLPDLIGTEEEYEVEQIVSHQGTSGCCKYLTTWKGYPSSENTWEPESNLQHVSEILSTYKQAHQLSYLTTITCPSSHHMIMPFPLDQLIYPGSWNSQSTNSDSFNYATSPLTVTQKISATGSSSHTDFPKGGAHKETQCP